MQETSQDDHPIGFGSFGVVWQCRDPRTKKMLALKKLPNAFNHLIAAKRMLREIKMLKYFKHENVIRTVGILKSAESGVDEIYLLTPLMDTDLHRIITHNNLLSTNHVSIIMYQIFRGLKYIHKANIMHRDLKPGNILMNKNCLLKICDFGLARSVVVPSPNTTMTNEVVTQYYRPPELFTGVNYYSTEIDIWSVGCILAELLTKKILFQCNSSSQQLDLQYKLLSFPTPIEQYPYPISSSSSLTQLNKQQKQHYFKAISSNSSPESNFARLSNDYMAQHMLSCLLVWNPDLRLNCDQALQHQFIDAGRSSFHNSLCNCCYHNNISQSRVRRAQTSDPEPVPSVKFDDRYEHGLQSLQDVKKVLDREVQDLSLFENMPPLEINPLSHVYPTFLASTVMQYADDEQDEQQDQQDKHHHQAAEQQMPQQQPYQQQQPHYITRNVHQQQQMRIQQQQQQNAQAYHQQQMNLTQQQQQHMRIQQQNAYTSQQQVNAHHRQQVDQSNRLMHQQQLQQHVSHHQQQRSYKSAVRRLGRYPNVKR